MSLDASGKPVVVARPNSAKAASSTPSKIKTSSSTSHSLPGNKQKSNAFANRSTAGSQRPGSAKASRARLTPLNIPSGMRQHKSSSAGVLSRKCLLSSMSKRNHSQCCAAHHDVHNVLRHCRSCYVTASTSRKIVRQYITNDDIHNSINKQSVTIGLCNRYSSCHAFGDDSV